MAEFDELTLTDAEMEEFDLLCSSLVKHKDVKKEIMTDRFASVDDDQISAFYESNHSASTKRNTRWGVKLFQDWHSSAYGYSLDMTDVEPAVLTGILSKFYCEARQQYSKSPGNYTHYHKNTLLNIRSAINRHLQDLGRTIDIVRDKDFVASNRVLSGMLKSMTASGLSRPTKHKDVIPESDLLKIQEYFGNAGTTPIVLRQCVWYQLAIHFCSRGLEFHHQLTKRSFKFLVDESGKEFVTLTHETCQKNFQGGLQSDEAQNDKRMYATGGINCPVEMLRLLIKKTVPMAQSLFNSMIPNAERNPQSFGCWYDDKPLSKRTFSNFLPDICKASNCSGRYTAHCLRATSITKMNDAGFEARHIMFMSGHRNESSIRSYNRALSSDQKHGLSKSLSSMTTGVVSDEPSVIQQSDCPTEHALVPQPVTKNVCSTSNATSTESTANKIIDSPHNFQTSNIHTQMGFLANTKFQKCTVNFNFK